MNKVDQEYFRLLQTILEDGKIKKNRTGTDTIGIFGEQAKFNIDLNAFPILTTKKVWFKGILHELLWFIKGDTNIKYLVDNDVHIWDEWAYKRYLQQWEKQGYSITKDGLKFGKDIGARSYANLTQTEFVQKIKHCPKPLFGEQFTQENFDSAEFAIRFGELGEGTYGGMWRNFPYYDGEDCEGGPGHVDQLQKVIDKLKSNLDDRRLIVSAWHPYWVDHCALPPCHVMFHFNTEELTEAERLNLWQRRFPVKLPDRGEMIPSYLPNFEGVGFMERFDKDGIPRRKLNCLLYQRSCDTFLGVPFNITSYCLLTTMIAHCVNMIPGTFTHTYGDLHIYTNHLDQVKEQLAREPMKLPSLWINPEIKDLFNLKYEDVKLVNYVSHPAIKGEVAV